MQPSRLRGRPTQPGHHAGSIAHHTVESSGTRQTTSTGMSSGTHQSASRAPSSEKTRQTVRGDADLPSTHSAADGAPVQHAAPSADRRRIHRGPSRSGIAENRHGVACVTTAGKWITHPPANARGPLASSDRVGSSPSVSPLLRAQDFHRVRAERRRGLRRSSRIVRTLSPSAFSSCFRTVALPVRQRQSGRLGPRDARDRRRNGQHPHGPIRPSNPNRRPCPSRPRSAVAVVHALARIGDEGDTLPKQGRFRELHPHRMSLGTRSHPEHRRIRRGHRIQVVN